MIFFGRHRHKSIWQQLLLFLIVSICLLSITSSVTAVWVSYNQSRQVLQQNSLRIADNLAHLSVLSLITASKENAHDALSQVLGFNDVTGVAIFSDSLDLLLKQGDVDWKNSDLDLWFPINAATTVKNTGSAWFIAAPVYLENTDPLSNDSGAQEFSLENNTKSLLGYVMIKVSKESLVKLINNLIIYNLLVTLIISILLIWLLNRGLRHLTSPLSKLSETMNEAQTSGDHLVAEIEGPREVQQMARSFNAMMNSLEQQENKLIELNTGLESEVEVRTHELVAARDTALVAMRTQSEFLANISHELRTPLQAVTSYIELVTEELEIHPEFDTQVEDLNSALHSSQRLLNLINAILDLAKCEAGKMDLSAQQCSLTDLIKETENTIRPLAAKNKNRFTIDHPSGDLYLNVDKEKIQQILLNLLSNACKFTEQGEISLKCYLEQNKIYWEVADTGIGIPKEQLAQVFNKFKQVDGSVKRKYGGTGLGLAIAKHYAEMMGGSITVSSTPNKGSVFTFWITIPNEERY
jgi:signal transduction histidine kinase